MRAWVGMLGIGAALSGCARRPALCETTCGEPGLACVAGECLREGRKLELGALDKYGQLQARRILASPVDVALVRPGDGPADHADGAVPRIARIGRARDASSVLLLRFAVDLPPGTTVVDAHVILDRATAVDVDPAPIVVHAARIVDRWDPRALAWALTPRIDEVDAPRTTVDPARRSARIDVRALVRRWRLHAPDDQGIAVLVDRASASGMGFALADGAGSSDDSAAVPSVRPLGSPDLIEASEAVDGPPEAGAPRGPRLELYVKP